MTYGDSEDAVAQRRLAYAAVDNEEVRLPALGWREHLRRRAVDLPYAAIRTRIGQPPTSAKSLRAWLRVAGWGR